MRVSALIKKELRELLMERTIIIGVILMPLIILPMIGGALSAAGETFARPTEEIRILLIDNDGGKYTAVFRNSLNRLGFTPVLISGSSGDIQELMREHGVLAAVVIVRGFSQSLADGQRASVQLFISMSSASTSEMQRISMLEDRVSAAIALLGEVLASERGLQLSFYNQPAKLEGNLFYRGRVMSFAEAESLIQLYFTTNLLIPLVLVIMIATSGTVAATSIGLEKEAKTLEMLLILPIRRTSILLAKLFSSSVIALIGTASMFAGLLIYLSSLGGFVSMAGASSTGASASEPMSSGLVFPLTSPALALLAVVLFVAMAITLSVGILAGVLAGDVRGGQQLAGLMQMPLLLLPFMLLQFTDIGNLPPTLSTALMLNPFTHMLLAIRTIYEEAYLATILHIGAMTAFMAAILAIAAWLFKGERLLTMRISLKRRSPP
ncbi:MAG: ABC transporter permease [Nitrososphaerota archaeon]